MSRGIFSIRKNRYQFHTSQKGDVKVAVGRQVTHNVIGGMAKPVQSVRTVRGPLLPLVRASVGLLARRAATGLVWLGVMGVAVGNRIGNAIGSRPKNEFPILKQALWILV